MSQYQLAIKQFVQYPPEHARVYVGRSIGIEINELLQVLTKPLYKGGDYDRHAALLELGDVLFNVAEACSIIGVDLDTLTEHAIPRVECVDDRFARMVIHAEKVWYGLRRHYSAEWILPNLRMLWTDLEWARENLLEKGATWTTVQDANIDKLTERQRAKQAAAL